MIRVRNLVAVKQSNTNILCILVNQQGFEKSKREVASWALNNLITFKRIDQALMEKKKLYNNQVALKERH